MYGNPYQPVPQYQNYQPQTNPYAERLNMMTQPTPPQNNVNWIRVGGIDDVKNIIVQPNGTAWAMDNNHPVFYVKTADSMGVCSIEAYRYERIDMSAPAENTAVSRAEFDALCAKINELEGKLNEPVNQSSNANTRNAVYAWQSPADGTAVPAVPPADAGA